MKIKIAIGFSIVMALLLGTVAFAQYAGKSFYTAYQVVNMGDGLADITIDYYDENGVLQTAASKQFSDVAPGGNVLVVQYTDDTSLTGGRYSAVISSNQPIAAITNLQLVDDAASGYQPEAPFSTYGGQSEGSLTLTLPAVMYNWFGWYTEFYVMNVGSGAANNIDIAYAPGKLDLGSGAQNTGATGVTDNDNTIAQFAALEKSQESQSALGAGGSDLLTGRFLGSATITSDQPVIAVVNQHNTGAKKLMTYNGFANAGATDILVPNAMRGYFSFYSTMLISNPSATGTATVDLVYTPEAGNAYILPAGGGTFTVTHTIAPQTALTRYDGADSSDVQSDLDDEFTRFFGSVRVLSDIPVMVQVNVEAKTGGTEPGQAGSYNGIPVADATIEIVAPVILADFYGIYTTLVVQNASATDGSCNITYTSDSVYSSVTDHSETYTHSISGNGGFTVYEGRAGGLEVGDINSDSAWQAGGFGRFLGGATISCDVPVVAFVNEETATNGVDTMYTMNTFNK